jgi:GT2 family glycosyltransferase/tetratricopeptide (TPR) repeat protein
MSVEHRPDKGRLLDLGDQARDQGRWDIAVEHYSAFLLLEPENAPIRVQLGHGLKEQGRLSEAEVAYRHAAALRPGDADARLHIGHVLKLQGRQSDALEAYAEALRLDPEFEPARHELIAAGRRNMLPDALYGRSAITEALTDLSIALRGQARALKDLASVSVFPIEAYDAYRHTYPLQPPPRGIGTLPPVLVIIDAREQSPAALRSTLVSLIDQNHPGWRAVVRCPDPVANHPVASLAAQDARITFVVPTKDEPPELEQHAGPVLLCDAGTELEPLALDWFATAQTRTGAALLYADHDHHSHHWRNGRTYTGPVLYGMVDAWDLESAPASPAILFVDPAGVSSAPEAIQGEAGEGLRRSLICNAARAGQAVAHIPLVLSSLREAEDAPPHVHHPCFPQAAVHPSANQVAIEVIIPTRDEVEALKTCVESLILKAARPGSLRLQVVDNRSSNRSTLEYLRSLADDGRVSLETFDEPFNWARLNNLSVQRSACDIIVFANNDLEMLTQDWDARAVARLADSSIGVMGTRLLFPDRTVQHAGIVLGVNDLRPVHDGLGRLAMEGGPQGRWLRSRQVAAVTGAFMVMRRDVFTRTGGFDETFAVSYNDVDLCLRVREAGLAVVYEAGIELIHHESKTRGRNDDARKVAWDDAELADLYARWGAWMTLDPGKSPLWLSTDTRPFDGLRNLTKSEVLQHIDLSARRLPWSIDRAIEFAPEVRL